MARARSNRLKAGVVGLGLAGTRLHIPSLARVKEAKLVAVCDRDEALAVRVARECRLPRYYTDFAQMLAEADLDYVHICTPPQTHHALALAAIEAGCSILTEKPFTMTLKQADEVIQRATSRDVLVSVIHNLLSYPTSMKARRLVEGGRIGTLTRVHALWGSPPLHPIQWTQGLPGGYLAELLPHVLYLTLAFTGSVREVQVGWAPPRTQADLPVGHVHAIIEGSRAVGRLTYGLDGLQPAELLLCGTHHTLRATYGPGHFLEFLPRGGASFKAALIDSWRELGAAGAALGRRWDLLRAVLFKRWRLGHRRQIQAFVDSLLGRCEPTVGHQDILEFMRAYEEILRPLPTSREEALASPAPGRLGS